MLEIVYTLFMKRIVRSTTVLAVVLMLGGGNLVYAASAGFCGMASGFSQGRYLSEKANACCENAGMKCHCKVTIPSKIFPQLAASFRSGLFLTVSSFILPQHFLPPGDILRRTFSFESPPGKAPLFSLYSVYRI